MLSSLFQDTMGNMAWPELRRLADRGALVLLPLGVIEEHGPHLCLGTDAYTAVVHCRAVRRKLEEEGHAAVIAPPFYWGVCQSTGGFIGSFQVRKETAKALLFDIVASLSGFGFREIVGISAHGDVEHSVAVMEAFREANETLPVRASFAFPQERLAPFGLTGREPHLCPVRPQAVSMSAATVPDVHAGDIETAMMHHFHPPLADVEQARALPPVPLEDSRSEDWLFGGHIRELSPKGYLGAPAEYAGVDVPAYLEDLACRIAEAILSRPGCPAPARAGHPAP